MLFSSEYPLTVRPISEGKFQIVSGHHRFEAANQLNIDALPCVVREMSDVDALIRNITSNDQRDNNPLDIGGAAKLACTKYVKGMTLREFADRVGVDENYLTRLMSACDVAEYVCDKKVCDNADFSVADFESKTRHLYEISKAPLVTS